MDIPAEVTSEFIETCYQSLSSLINPVLRISRKIRFAEVIFNGRIELRRLLGRDELERDDSI
jgi:hypothetical protein